MAVLTKELIFMTAVCDSVKEVAVWAKHANGKEICLPLKDSGPQGLCSQSFVPWEQRSFHHLPSPNSGYFQASLAPWPPSVPIWITSVCGLRGRLAKARQIEGYFPVEPGFSSACAERGPGEKSQEW